MSAVARALAGLHPEADGVDIARLAAAEEKLAALRAKREAPIAETQFTPRLQSVSDRRKLRQEGVALSQEFNSIGMACLDSSPEVAFECLQNAISAAPRGSQPVASLSNLGLCCLRRGKPVVAIRYLRRAIAADEPLEPPSRARTRLHLCAALNQLGEHNAALEQAEAAAALLGKSARHAPDGVTREVSDATCGAGEDPSATQEKQVLRAVALHNCCACYEHLGQYSFALQAARRALRVAAGITPPEEALLARLIAVEKAVSAKERELLARAGKGFYTSDDHRLTKSDPLPPLNAMATREAAVADAHARPRQIRKRNTETLLLSLTKPTKAYQAAAVQLREEQDRRRAEKLAPLPMKTSSSASSCGRVSDRLTKATAASSHSGRRREKAETRVRVGVCAASGTEATAGHRKVQHVALDEPVVGSNDESKGTFEKMMTKLQHSRSAVEGMRGTLRTPESTLQAELDVASLCAHVMRNEEALARLIKLQARARGMIARRCFRQKKVASVRGIILHNLLRRRMKLYIAAFRLRRQQLDALLVEAEASGSLRGMTRAQAKMLSSHAILPGNVVRGGLRSFFQLKDVFSSKEAKVSRILLSNRSDCLTLQRNYSKLGGKTLRVFLSSTFRDMTGEREIFTRQYVGALRQMCLDMGVHLFFVDLRWGVTIDQATNGEVVNICLSEMQRSDYFVGFLGARYGYRPARDEITPDTFERYPFIKSYIPGRSVTELEFIYGALGWEPGCECRPYRAFFYERQDSFYETIEPEKLQYFCESQPFPKSKLRDLKRRVLGRYKESVELKGRANNGSKLPFVECHKEYATPAEFAEHVYEALRGAIQKDFGGQRKSVGELEEQFVSHVGYAKQLLQVYQVQDYAQDAIEEYVLQAFNASSPPRGSLNEVDEGESPQAERPHDDAARTPLVIFGTAGSGKSSALAHWLLNNRRSGFVLPHFVGSSHNSTNHIEIIRRILVELQRAFKLEGDVPNTPDGVTELLPLWLFRACEIAPVTIIVDGLEQLQDESAFNLRWLPSKLPPRCNLLLSAAIGSRAAKAVSLRGWSRTITMRKLTPAMKGKLVHAYLTRLHKTLEEDVMAKLVRAEQTDNALFLTMTIEELVTTAVFETVHEIVDHILAQSSALDLCKMVLTRYEEDFGRQLVEKAFVYIHRSRFGIGEGELLALLDVTLDKWSPFYLSARRTLAVNGGLLNICNHVMRSAVAHRYLATETQVTIAHQELLRFFETASSDIVNTSRKNEEMPFHMLHSGAYEALQRFLLELPNFKSLWATRRFDLHMYWRSIGDGTLPKEIGPLYCEALDRYLPILTREVAAQYTEFDSRKSNDVQDRMAQLCTSLGECLSEMNHLDSAVMLQQRALDIDHTLFNNMSRRVAEATAALALTKHKQGLADEAMDKLYLVLGIFKQLAKTDPSCQFDCAATLVQIAEVARRAGSAAHAKGQLGSALRTYKHVLGENHPDVAHVHNSMGGLLFEIGTPEALLEARSHVEAAIAITDDCITESDITAADSRYILAQINMREGNLEGALKYMKQALEIRQNIYGYHHLAVIEVLEDMALVLLRITEEKGEHSLSHFNMDTQDEDADESALYAPLNLVPPKRKDGSVRMSEAEGFDGAAPADASGDEAPTTAGETTPGVSSTKGSVEDAESATPPQQKAKSVTPARGKSFKAVEPATLKSKNSKALSKASSSMCEEEEEDDESEDESVIPQAMKDCEPHGILQHALKVRRKKQGPQHIDTAYCLIKVAEGCWATYDFEGVLELYTEALKIMRLRHGKETKAVAQVTMWMTAAHMWLRNYQHAAQLNEKALAMVKKVFGEQSWEVHRALLDKVYILQRSFDKENPSQSSEARKAFSMAERVETHATILLNHLTSDKVADDVLPLSHFAPIRRTWLIDLQNEIKPFVRSDAKEGAGDAKVSRKAGAVGFKPDARKSKGPPNSTNVHAMARKQSAIGAGGGGSKSCARLYEKQT